MLVYQGRVPQEIHNSVVYQLIENSPYQSQRWLVLQRLFSVAQLQLDGYERIFDREDVDLGLQRLPAALLFQAFVDNSPDLFLALVPHHFLEIVSSLQQVGGRAPDSLEDESGGPFLRTCHEDPALVQEEIAAIVKVAEDHLLLAALAFALFGRSHAEPDAGYLHIGVVVNLLIHCCYETLPLYFQPHVQVLEVRLYYLNFSREQLCSLDVDLTSEQETIPVGSLYLMPKLGLLLVVLVLVLFLGVAVGVGRERGLDSGGYFVDGIEPHLAVEDSEVVSVPGVPLL